MATKTTIIENLSPAEAKALRLLKRTSGASLESLCKQLGFEEERQGRSVIDRLRRKGVSISRIGAAKFHAEEAKKGNGARK